MSSDESAIKAVLQKYEDALNASSTDMVMPLYTSDGIFMPQHSPSAIGTTALQEAYDFVFKTLQLSVKFEVQEAVALTAEWGFARTSSAGTQKIHASGKTGNEANQELFVMQKVDGNWKIARYCFCTTLPPH
ncbi:hypothetical protein MMC19_002925 [Ptychographa xylographoides]|nr:hypothetical protein [Ptychographa xylographoides]